MNEINTVQLIIRKFLFAIKDLRKEDSAAGRWLDWLGETLQYQDLMENMEPFGAEMLAEAKVFSMKKRLGGQLKAAKGSLIKEGNNTPTAEEIEERRIEMYGEEAVEITAAATTREGVDVVHDRESGSLVRTTGCNHSQVAPTSNAGDESSDARKGAALKSATACNPLTADATHREAVDERQHLSNGELLESGTSANSYDQEPTMISTYSPAGAGVNLDSTQTNKRPDASSGNAEGVNTNGSTTSKNGSRAVCTSAPSGQTFEALQNTGAAGGSPEFSSSPAALPVPTKTDPKPAKKAKAEQKPEETKYPHGEFENIMLTTKEYIQLTERLDNADALIDEADQYFEAQPDKKRKYKSHYAMLLNWDRRRKDFEKPKMVQRFKTIDDINQERIAKAKREIYEMFHPGESKAV